MSRKLVASRDCAIALASTFNDDSFRKNPTVKTLAKTMNRQGLSGSKASSVMHCLRDLKAVRTVKGKNQFVSYNLKSSCAVMNQLRKREVI